MLKEEIKKELEMPLPELYKYLKRKYGLVPENYFMDVNCTRKSVKNGRGNEGLFVHHDYEYDPANPLVSNLSDSAVAKQFDYMYQHAENLTYCNYLEHLIIHKAKLWLDSGKIFGESGNGFQRINVACPRATLTEALERIKKALP